MAHYEKAMRDAGWTVEDGVPFAGHGPAFGGREPAGMITMVRLEGNAVGVYSNSAEELDGSG